jgi:hypothetical protein
MALGGGGVFAVAVAGGGAYGWVGAHTLSGLAAKTTCSCVFVSGRPEAICSRDELEAQGVGFVKVSVDRGAAAVEARALGIGRARAVWRAENGCTLE